MERDPKTVFLALVPNNGPHCERIATAMSSPIPTACPTRAEVGGLETVDVDTVLHRREAELVGGTDGDATSLSR